MVRKPLGSVPCPRKLMPETIKINPENPEQALIERAVGILKSGGVIAYPTETFYGLGADAGNAEAVEKIFLIKRRPLSKPLTLILGDKETLVDLVTEISPASRRLMQAFWPGALTLIFHASPCIIPCLTAGTGTIGIRVSSHPVARALAKTLRFPITATSANLSGEGECSSAAQVRKRLGDRIDAIVDGGKTEGGVGSTILDMTSAQPAILREGTIPASRLTAILEKLL
jgi:L-threonylcarbamoyladenylate synthase